MSTRPRGSTAVMADKASAAEIEAEANPLRRLHLKLNYFPTPPWATRALLEHILVVPGDSPAGSRPPGTSCWEPAAGEGHMAAVLGEYFDEVWRTDVHDHGGLNAVGSFVGDGLDVALAPDPAPDWIITNPPFPTALEFAERALREAEVGVALLVRTPWLEGGERYERLFSRSPPTVVAPFVERVPMTLGCWDPEASTATSYAWFVWVRLGSGDWPSRNPQLEWIPPGCRKRLTRADDVRRFGKTEID